MKTCMFVGVVLFGLWIEGGRGGYGIGGKRELGGRKEGERLWQNGFSYIGLCSGIIGLG
jgi:hypothetical protein